MWDRGYDQLVADMKARFGFELELYNTGGWCMVYEAKLEGNVVIWISDYDAGVTPREERLSRAWARGPDSGTRSVRTRRARG